MANAGSGSIKIVVSLKIIAVVILVIVTAALTFLALTKANPPVEGVGQTPGYAPQSVAEEEQSSSTQHDESGNQEDLETSPENEGNRVVPLSRVMTAVGGNTVLRATTGACPTVPAVVETSSDGGITWVSEDLANTVPIASLSRLLDLGDGFAAAVGYDSSNCEEQLALVTVSGSGAWTPFGTENIWKLNPADTTFLNGPAGSEVSPECEIARFAANAEGTLAVLCSDGELRVSVDLGVNWNVEQENVTNLNGIPDAVALSAETVYLASVQVPGCEGVSVSSLGSIALEPINTVCVASGSDGTALLGNTIESGQTALAYAPDGALWLWAGDSLVKSVDGGQTWG